MNSQYQRGNLRTISIKIFKENARGSHILVVGKVSKAEMQSHD